MFPEARFEGPPVAVVDWAAWSRCGTLRPANGDAWGADGVTRFAIADGVGICLLYTSPSPRDATLSRMPSSA